MRTRPTRPLRSALVAAALACTAAAGFVADELVLKEKDHKDLGAAIRGLVEAESKDSKALAKARTGVTDLVAKLGKAARKLNEPAAATQAVLAMTGDLAKAIYQIDEHKMSGVKLGDVASGTIETERSESGKLTYAVWTPKTYKATAAPIPLVLFVPGMKDGKPYASKQFLIENWSDAAAKDAALLVAVDMPADPAIWTKLSLDDGNDGGMGVVMRVFGSVTRQYNVDFDRVFVVGVETGLPVALHLASSFPHCFAGVIGQRGDAGDASSENLRNVPTWFSGGGAACTAFEEKTRAAGFDNCTIQQDGTDAAAWAWASEKRRVANPARVNLVLGNPAPFSAYWILTERQEPSPGTRIDAEVDRATNKVVINAKGVKRVTVFYNDVLLDLDKPVKIVCNGVEREEKIARSLDDFLDFAKKRSLCNGDRVYVATRMYDMPPPKD